jgi:predicted ATP-grasp superfamily ATP-dependent carboligase
MVSETRRLPPAIVLGGMANALSITRSLGRAGIKVYALNEPDSHVRYSRFCHRCVEFPWSHDNAAEWARFLLGSASNHLRGSVVLAACDNAIEMLIEHREQLASKFLLDESNPQAQQQMLNKLDTYQQARAAGVPVPHFWVAENPENLKDLKSELIFPLIVKPLLSHFVPRFGGKKFVLVRNFEELEGIYRKIGDTRIATVLMEHIPGPDDRLCSYYTYLDEDSQPLFHFTKRIIRRFPVGMGTGCYHVTDWNPEVRDVALPLFQYVKLRGLANAEFKRDERDGKLKLIECNARFTAANCLVAASGFDLPLFVYNRLVGRPQAPLVKYRTGMRLWYPVDDFKAFRELHARGEMTWGRWLASLCHRKMLPFFRWDDPRPTLAAGVRWTGIDRVAGRLRRLVGRAVSWLTAPFRMQRYQRS